MAVAAAAPEPAMAVAAAAPEPAMAVAAATPPEPTLLCGPPFIRGARPPPVVGPSSHPFLELLDAGFNSPGPEALRDRRFDALGPDPCVDFFFQVQPGTSSQRVCDLLAAAWAHSPLTALKLVCNLRSVHGTGKSDMEGFYAAALWIHGHHPKTLACNIPELAQLGYLKDFPELLFRIIQANDVRMIARDNQTKAAPAKAVTKAAAVAGRKRRRKASLPFLFGRSLHLSVAISAAIGRKHCQVGWKRRNSTTVDAETVTSTEFLDAEFAAAGEVKLTGEMMETALLAVRALDWYWDDSNYHNLFDRITQVFTDFLLLDMQKKDLNLNGEIGLAAKWCPSPGSCFDRSTLICEGIARRLFPCNAGYALMSDEAYRYHILKRLCNEVLAPLRKEGKEGKRAGEETHNTLLPHTIAYMCNSGAAAEAELQWRAMMRNLHDKGLASQLRNCIAVCDVSDSMKGVPMEVGMALSVLFSELSEDPWSQKVVAFSRDPKLHSIQGKSFQEKLGFVEGLKIDTDRRVNFKALYNNILDMAEKTQLPSEKMIKTIFVFSNRGFDDVSLNPWIQDYRASCRRFQSAGYHDVVPQMVFWNLQGPREVTCTNAGVMKLKGFSDSLLKLFLEYGGVIHAKDEMTSALSGKEYANLSLFD